MFRLSDLAHPIVQAPMAGGPSIPELAAAVGEAGGLGFLAAGYLSPEALAEQIARTRELTRRPFGVNLFVPESEPTDPEELAAYSAALRPLRERYGVEEPEELPAWSEDHWERKTALLLEDPVPAVGFTFGLPPRELLEGLRAAGTWTALTVTTAEEARRALELAPDALVVQSHQAGGHRGVLDQRAPLEEKDLPELLREVATLTRLPLVGAGGVGTAQDVRAALDAGAAAVQAGTAFALAEEAGTNPVHRAALAAAGSAAPTVVTRAFSGRAARALENRFTREMGPHQIAGYPQVHYLTGPLRTAARGRGDADGVNLWAGTGAGDAVPGTAREVLGRLLG